MCNLLIILLNLRANARQTQESQYPCIAFVDCWQNVLQRTPICDYFLGRVQALSGALCVCQMVKSKRNYLEQRRVPYGFNLYEAIIWYVLTRTDNLYALLTEFSVLKTVSHYKNIYFQILWHSPFAAFKSNLIVSASTWNSVNNFSHIKNNCLFITTYFVINCI